jgi:hypothetical protein
MIDVKEIKKNRFDFLRTLYDETGGDIWKSYFIADIGRKLGFDLYKAEKIAQYLHDERLIEIMSKDRDIRILHRGIQEVEEAIENPDKPTDHFPKNVINIGTMIDSQISQASPGTTQLNILTAADRLTIDEDLALMKECLDQLKLLPEQESDLQAEMKTIEAQMKSSKPKRGVIEAAYASIKGILQSAAGGVAAHVALQLLNQLRF